MNIHTFTIAFFFLISLVLVWCLLVYQQGGVVVDVLPGGVANAYPSGLRLEETM